MKSVIQALWRGRGSPVSRHAQFPTGQCADLCAKGDLCALPAGRESTRVPPIQDDRAITGAQVSLQDDPPLADTYLSGEDERPLSPQVTGPVSADGPCRTQEVGEDGQEDD